MTPTQNDDNTLRGPGEPGTVLPVWANNEYQ